MEKYRAIAPQVLTAREAEEHLEDFVGATVVSHSDHLFTVVQLTDVHVERLRREGWQVYLADSTSDIT